jgi:hypothetical protein
MLAVLIKLYLYELYFELHWCAQIVNGEQVRVTVKLNIMWKLEAICFVAEERQTPHDDSNKSTN